MIENTKRNTKKFGKLKRGRYWRTERKKYK